MAHSLLTLKAYYFPRVSWCSFFVRISNNITILFLEHNANIRDGADYEKGNLIFLFCLTEISFFLSLECVIFLDDPASSCGVVEKSRQSHLRRRRAH